MKAKELIKLLSECHPDSEVYYAQFVDGRDPNQLVYEIHDVEIVDDEEVLLRSE